jgi:hypothetical protein
MLNRTAWYEIPMRAISCALLLFSTTALAEGNELEAVRAALGELTGSERVEGSFSVSRWERVSGDKPKDAKEASAGATFAVSASKSSVSLAAPESLLAPRAEPRKDAPPDVLQNIIEGVDLARVSRWLNHARPLLKQLESAEVLEASDTQRGDVPARLLKLKLKTERQSEGGAEAVTERTLLLWVDAQHLPLASQLVEDSSGGFLVVRFENHHTAERTYARVGDRLVLVEETGTSSTNGMGKTFQSKQTARLTLK